VLHNAAACCSILQCVAACCSMLDICIHIYKWSREGARMDGARGVVLQCVAACCSVLQRVAVCMTSVYIYITSLAKALGGIKVEALLICYFFHLRVRLCVYVCVCMCACVCIQTNINTGVGISATPLFMFPCLFV